MNVVSLHDAAQRPRRIAVGTFDGVHLGHQRVIEGSESVLTFDPHPVSVVAPEHTPRLLSSRQRKAELLAALGVREMIVIPFTAEFAGHSAEYFIHEVLEQALSAQRVSVGENFRFGNRAKGTPEMMAAVGAFQTVVAPLLEIDGEVVSSSRIRALLAAGDVALAERLLGQPFELRGEVVSGDARGRTLGFPTANLVPDEHLICPGHGVYACLAKVCAAPAEGQASPAARGDEGQAPNQPGEIGPSRADGWLPAAVSIGVRPTFLTGRGELIEAHLLDFDGDLYGKPLSVRFLARLRGERRFGSAEELVAQMHKDVAHTRARAAG